MLKHIVLWKLKDVAEGADKQANARKIKSELEGLKQKMDCIRTIEVGFNKNNSPDSYDLALYSEFDSLNDLETYQKHPEHLKAAEFVNKVRLERKVVDYEI